MPGRCTPPGRDAANLILVPARMAASGTRLASTLEVTPASAGIQVAASKRARGSPTSQAIAAEPGSSNAVVPSGTVRASNWLAPVTPSAPPATSLCSGVLGSSARCSGGVIQSAQASSGPPFGPATSRVTPSGNAMAAGAALAANGNPTAARPLANARRPMVLLFFKPLSSRLYPASLCPCPEESNQRRRRTMEPARHHIAPNCRPARRACRVH